nr:unnamed protein product [Callosobruchus chinensis]
MVKKLEQTKQAENIPINRAKYIVIWVRSMGNDKTDRQRLEVTEMDFLRRSCGVSGLEKIKNEEIRRRTNVQISVTEEIERRMLKWYGQRSV